MTGKSLYLDYDIFQIRSDFSDKFSVNVVLEKGGNPIAQGDVALPAMVLACTHLSLPLTYTVEEVPDNAIIQISIIGPVTGQNRQYSGKSNVSR